MAGQEIILVLVLIFDVQQDLLRVGRHHFPFHIPLFPPHYSRDYYLQPIKKFFSFRPSFISKEVSGLLKSKAMKIASILSVHCVDKSS